MNLDEAMKRVDEKDWTISRYHGYRAGKFHAEVFMGDGVARAGAWGETAAEALHNATEALLAHTALPR